MQLLDAIKPLRRGLTATPDDQQRIDKLARQLERLNPTKKPLASDLINGQWELLYTTSESILGTNKPPFLRPLGPIYQIIGALQKHLRACTFPALLLLILRPPPMHVQMPPPCVRATRRQCRCSTRCLPSSSLSPAHG